MHPSLTCPSQNHNPFIFGPTRRVSQHTSMQQLRPAQTEQAPPLPPLPPPPINDREPEEQENEYVTTDRLPTPPPKDRPSGSKRRSRYIPLDPFVLRAREAHRRSRYITIDEFVTCAREAEARARELSEIKTPGHKHEVLKRCKSRCVKEGRNSFMLRSCVPSTRMRAVGRRVSLSWTPASCHDLKRRWTVSMGTSAARDLPSRCSTSLDFRSSMRPTALVHLPRRQRARPPDPESLTDQVFAELRAAIDASVNSFRAARKAEKNAVKSWFGDGTSSEDKVRIEKEKNMLQIRDKMEDLKLMLEREQARDRRSIQHLEGRRSWGGEWDFSLNMLK